MAFSESFWGDVRQELRHADTEIFATLDSSIPNEVTHYTSLEGLKGIIATRELWCTDLRQVDDSHECDYGMEIIRRVIVRKSVPSDFVNLALSLNSLFGAKENFTFYISCFCSSHDVPRMWDDYAAGGAGCAIVFDAKTIFTGADGGKAYAFAPVIYDERTQLDKTSELIDRAIQLQRKWNIPKRELARYWFGEVAFWLLVCGLRFKAPCWDHQQEIRIALAERDGLRPFSFAGRTRVALPFEFPAILRIIRAPSAAVNTDEQIRDALALAGYKDGVPIL